MRSQEKSTPQALHGNCFQKAHVRNKSVNCFQKAHVRNKSVYSKCRSKHMLGQDFIFKKTYSGWNLKMSKEKNCVILLSTGKLHWKVSMVLEMDGIIVSFPLHPTQRPLQSSGKFVQVCEYPRERNQSEELIESEKEFVRRQANYTLLLHTCMSFA